MLMKLPHPITPHHHSINQPTVNTAAGGPNAPVSPLAQ